jgi:membrane dipeptidase
MNNPDEKTAREKAWNIHQSSVVMDAHHDILMDVLQSRQNGEKARLNTYWAPKLRQGGINVQVLPIYVDTQFLPEQALRITLRTAEAYLADLDEDASTIAPARSFYEIEKRLSEGKIAALLGLEGVEGFGTDLEMFQVFYRLGLRVVSLTWNHRNAFADGTGEQGTNGGLTRLGFEAVDEMNRLNILIDVSHINQACFFDVLKTTNQTVIASHSNACGIYDHPRNLSDDQIRALADNGGVMGLLIHPGIIDPDHPTISRCVDHLAYVADLVGIDHIGLGTDFTEKELSIATTQAMSKLAMVDLSVLQSGIEGLSKIEELPHLTEEMVRRGFSEVEIRKILGENFLRVMKKVLV